MDSFPEMNNVPGHASSSCLTESRQLAQECRVHTKS